MSFLAKVEPLDALGYMSQFKYRKGEFEERVYAEHIPVRYIKAMITLVKPYLKDGRTEYTDPESRWPKNVNYIYFDRATKKATLLP